MPFNRFIRAAALAAIAAGAPFAAHAADLHAIFVIDTNDKNIGRMVAKDLNIVGAEVQKIAQATGLNLRDRVYAGNDFTIENVRAAVNAAQPGPDDVMFFYYSGHGFRTPTKKSDWPYFYFHSNNTIDFGWVAGTLADKGARLTVALVDACNNPVNIQVRELQKAVPAGTEGYRDLFLKHKGYVAGASSIPGETSIATASGSLFTLSFLNALHQEVGQRTTSWDRLMKNAAGKRLTSGSSSQQPFYKMAVKRVTVAATPPLATPPTGTPPSPNVQPPAPTVVMPPAPTVTTPPAVTANPPQATPSSPPPPVTPPAPATPPTPAAPPAQQQGGWQPITM